MIASPDDRLAASIFAVGLELGHVRHEDIIEWADRRITEIEIPPTWLIDLSLSRNAHPLDVTGNLKRVAFGVEPLRTCTAIYAILARDLSGFTSEEAEEFAGAMYMIAFKCFDGDWNNELLCVTDRLADNFEFNREGWLNWSRSRAIEALQQFLAEFRDDSIPRLVRPVKWLIPSSTATRPQRTSDDLAFYVGLSSWIIQDGNYSDFSVADQRDFAVEFYPAQLSPANSCEHQLNHLRLDRYRVRARVAYVTDRVWVIDMGPFMAFHEGKPPADVVSGVWVEGEVHIAIDPYFYFEYLHKLEGMPPLTYTWLIQAIKRVTAPWIEAVDKDGWRYQVRDERREALVPTRKTNAWNDENGIAEYLLECQRIGGPKHPQ
jgi:hypothetical protein